MYLDRAFSYWASKEIGKASENAIKSAELILTPENNSKELLAETILASYALTRKQNTGNSERAKADKLFEQGLKRVSARNPYSLDAVLIAIPSEIGRAQVIVRIDEVLKEAPRLDWALWGLLYMELIVPDEAKGLLSKLPNDSLQSRLLDVLNPKMQK